ncbi:MAG: ADP-forming succinate--CoA ligase subunit beta [Clostridiales bacterium]|nr:ADP-forming succinate--CoA ligase subunit beta [Clostridiales bacterium]
MKIHEYQAKELFAQYGVTTQEGYVAVTKEEAVECAKKLNDSMYVVKAQAHCGGRGKAGGVKLARSIADVEDAAGKIIGMRIVNKQTGAEGKLVRKVLVTGAVNIKKEYYLSLAIDNENAAVVIIASGAGGTEIEEIAATKPELIVKQLVSPINGLRDYEARYVAKKIGIPKENTKEFIVMLKNMYRLFIEKDCSLVEINPLVETEEGKLIAIDGKVNFDDNALFRHPDIVALRDIDEENPKEYEAGQHDLNYVSLDGSIGCMVNGAGLAMATMDIIHAFGGEPANFLDVGGTATTERVTAAFKILSDPSVKAILVNIFGGIVKCDVIAEGIVIAAKEVGLNVPLVVRLDGTNVERGKSILKESGLKIYACDDLRSAAKKAVEMAK